MNKSASWSSHEESLLLLNAYFDKELDAASMLDVERRIAADAALKAEYECLLELRTALTSHLRTERASDALRQRIAAIAGPVRPVAAKPLRPGSYTWQHMAAAATLAACVAGVATYMSLLGETVAGQIATIVDDHQRALLAAAPFDVASSDRHTVKPWFDSKLALSPQVVDLSSEGFPLAGGRIEVLDGRPVPVLVYMRRAHIISVVAIPAPDQKDNAGMLQRTTRNGYSVIRWKGRDFEYAVVSDLAENELDEFVERWRDAIAKQ